MSLGFILEVVVEVFLVAELESLGHHGVPGELGVDGLGGQTEHLEVCGLVGCKKLVVSV